MAIRVSVDAGALQMVINALRRDAEEGKAVRGEMADELEQSMEPMSSNVMGNQVGHDTSVSETPAHPSQGHESSGQTRCYAGIGSRRTPPEMLERMKSIAKRLAQRGYALRSGAADGADAAFEEGCLQVAGKAEIWMPWPGFNNHEDTKFMPSPAHSEMAKSLHPNWDRLTRGPRALHSRNVGQILGADLKTPVDFVVCWTPDGCESEASRNRDTGGTGTAIALASRHGIPVFNLAKEDALDRLKDFLAHRETPTASERYDENKIAEELIATALGHAYHGNALRVAKDIKGLNDNDRACLDRWATGRQENTDHVLLQEIANKVSGSQVAPQEKPKSAGIQRKR